MRQWLKQLREEKNLTQCQLAKMLGISQQYYCTIEKGIRQKYMSIELAYKLTKIFDISIDEIVTKDTKRG